jgi:chloramphenicol-sensitive protein RarD
LEATRAGGIYATAAFGFWGLSPIYYKLLPGVPPVEVLCHRIVWSVVFGAIFLAVMGAWAPVREAFRRPGLLGTLALTAALVSVNWLVYIYAIANDQVIATSLGYYINPLVNVLLGMLFLGERLSRGRIFAVALAVAGTGSLAVNLGGLPWIALTLAFSFGIYGLIRKRLGLAAMPALFVETLLVLPFALAGLAWLASRGESAFTERGTATALLLVLAGPVTLLPLWWFAEAARRLPYVVVGFFQYLAPSTTFLLAVLVYGEPLTPAWAVAFALIWAALAVFTFDGLQTRARLRARAPQ